MWARSSLGYGLSVKLVVLEVCEERSSCYREGSFAGVPGILTLSEQIACVRNAFSAEPSSLGRKVGNSVCSVCSQGGLKTITSRIRPRIKKFAFWGRVNESGLKRFMYCML